MKISSSRGRSIGRSGSRGISSGPSKGFRPSGSFRSSGGFKPSSKNYSSGFNNINRHHSHLYRRNYGNSVIPLWARMLFFFLLLLLMTVAS